MWLVWGRGEAYTGFCWGDLRERDHLEDQDVDGRIILSSSVKLIGPWMFLILSTTLVSVSAECMFNPKRYWYKELTLSEVHGRFL